MTYDEVNDYFNKLKPFSPGDAKPGELLFDLATVKELAEKMNNPQDATPCVHVTGTNGKGSFCAFLAAILTDAGYKTGVFSSPYLSDRTEQISINGRDISREDFAVVAKDVIEQAEEASEFEITTVAAFEYFKRAGCDIAVIEVGLGGEYDATNIISAPLLAVFTSISTDHTQVMGDTPEDIARIKSGIIKNNTDALIADNKETVVNIISDRCKDSGGRVFLSHPPEIITASLEGTVFDYSFDEKLMRFEIKCPGVFQAANAARAIDAAGILKCKGYEISAENVQSGLLKVRRPARFEVLKEKPLFIADGSHNPGAIDALALSLKSIFPGKSFIFITGVLADKNYREMLNPVMGIAKIFHTVTPDNPRALSGDELAAFLKEKGAAATAHESPENAINTAFAEAKDGDVIVAFGSLSYMGRLREIVSLHN